jgi:hypothetical protein
MTAVAKQIIDSFESLPDPEKREVLAKLLRIGAGLDYPGMADDELVASANEIFKAYDEAEVAE